MSMVNLQRGTCVVLLNWNGYADTLKCVESLRKSKSSGVQIVVVDNGSTDESVVQLQKLSPKVDILETGKNLGFAGGCNAGIRFAMQSGADYIWLLNNDTEVDLVALSAMIEMAESDTAIGAVGSVIHSMSQPSQILVWGGGHINFFLGTSHHFTDRVPDDRIDFLSGASILIRRSMIEQLGLLDDSFFMYWEDADYCFRLRRAGFRLAVAPESKIWHKEQGSVGKKSVPLDVYFNQSAVRFFAKHASFPVIPVAASVTRRLARWALMGDWPRFRAVWSGIRQTRVSLLAQRSNNL
jgi:GT2 family glycosyltransferase